MLTDIRAQRQRKREREKFIKTISMKHNLYTILRNDLFVCLFVVSCLLGKGGRCRRREGGFPDDFTCNQSKTFVSRSGRVRQVSSKKGGGGKTTRKNRWTKVPVKEGIKTFPIAVREQLTLSVEVICKGKCF